MWCEKFEKWIEFIGGGTFTELCASRRSRNACQDFTRATLYGNLQWAPWSSTGLYTYRKNPSVWTHCLGKNISQREILASTIFQKMWYVAGSSTVFRIWDEHVEMPWVQEERYLTTTASLGPILDSRSIKLTFGFSKMLFHHHCFATISVYKCQMFEPSIYFCRITPLHCTNYNNNISWDIWWVQQTALPKFYHCD